MYEPSEVMRRLEAAASALVAAFEIHAPPIPVETMLREPRPGMWETVDINKLSGTFMSLKDIYSPRMSLARMLVRHVVNSPWGSDHDLLALLRQDEHYVRAFARMLVMPREMIDSLTPNQRNPGTIAVEFEVPEDDARQRLAELSDYR
ncbi:MAG: hypothetical protein ACOCXZ_01360 [Chloroflexota bacterium]